MTPRRYVGTFDAPFLDMKAKKVARRALKHIRKNGLAALGWFGTSAAVFGAGMLTTSLSGRVHGRMQSMIQTVRARMTRAAAEPAEPVGRRSTANGARRHASA